VTAAPEYKPSQPPESEDPELQRINDALAARNAAKGKAEQERRAHNLSVALTFAAIGVPVFPCSSEVTSKKPLIDGWKTEASFDPLIIDIWWTQFPDAVPGWSPGALGLLAMDYDRKPGQPDGVAHIFTLAAQHGASQKLDVPAMTLTPTNGVHQVFIQPAHDTLGNVEGALSKKGINVRGKGGYLICEGAIMANGGRYTPCRKGMLWALHPDNRKTALTPLPAFIYDAITAKRKPLVHVDPNGEVTDAHQEFFTAKLEELAHKVQWAPDGTGNTELNAKVFMIAKIAALGWGSADAIRDSFSRAMALRGERTGRYNEREAGKTIESGISSGFTQPGGPLVADFHEWLLRERVQSGSIALGGPEPQPEPVPEVEPQDMTKDQSIAAALASMRAQEAGQPASQETPAPDPDDGNEQFEGGASLTDIRARLLRGMPTCGPESSEWMTRLVDANYKAMKVPFRPFALFATTAFMGGLLGRKYKTQDGLSTALFMLQVARTGTGKGEALGFWPKKFISARNQRRLRKSPVYNGAFSSTESMHGDIQSIGTTIHYRADAGGDLKGIAQPANKTDEQLRDKLYEFYDASRFGEADMMPPSSISAKKRGDRPIKGACLSLIWSVTPEEFAANYSLRFLASGGGQRLIVSHHSGHAGDPIPDDQIEKDLPADIELWLRKLLDSINDIDTAYYKASRAENPRDGEAADYDEAATQLNNARNLTVIIGYDEGAKAAIWKLELAVSEIMRKVNTNNLPSHYAVFGRTAMTVKRLALISAVLRNHAAPTITELDVAWGLNFALDCLISLAASIDRGDSGDATDGARVSAVLGWLADFHKNKNAKISWKNKQAGIAPLWWLKENADRNKAFTGAKYQTAHFLLEKTLDGLSADDRLVAHFRAGAKKPYAYSLNSGGED